MYELKLKSCKKTNSRKQRCSRKQMRSLKKRCSRKQRHASKNLKKRNARKQRRSRKPHKHASMYGMCPGFSISDGDLPHPRHSIKLHGEDIIPAKRCKGLYGKFLIDEEGLCAEEDPSKCTATFGNLIEHPITAIGAGLQTIAGGAVGLVADGAICGATAGTMCHLNITNALTRGY